jgi:hypothetical protein
MSTSPNLGAPAPPVPEASPAPATDTAPTPEPVAPPAPDTGTSPATSQETAVTENPFASENFAIDWNAVNQGIEPEVSSISDPAASPAPDAGQEAKPSEVAPPADVAAAPAPEPPAQPAPEMGVMVEQIGGESTLTAISTLMDAATQSPEDATRAALGVVDVINRLDPRAGNGLVNAIYEQFPQVKEWALADLGLTPELIEAARSIGTGGATEVAETFPEPDEFGVVSYEGQEYDLNIPMEKKVHDLLKADFDRTQQGKQQALEAARQQADAAEQAKIKARENAEAAATEFSSTRQSNYLKTFDELNLNFGEGKENFVQAARALGLMQIQHDAEFQNLLIKGMDVAARGGEGAKIHADKLDLLVNQKISEISKQFSDHFAYVARLEAAVNGTNPIPPPEPNNPKPATGGSLPPPPSVPSNSGLVNTDNPFAPENFRVPKHLFDS